MITISVLRIFIEYSFFPIIITSACFFFLPFLVSPVGHARKSEKRSDAAEWICDHCDTAMPGFYQRCSASNAARKAGVFWARKIPGGTLPETNIAPENDGFQ